MDVRKDRTNVQIWFPGRGWGVVGVLGVCGGRAGGRGIELPTSEVPWLKTTVLMVSFSQPPVIFSQAYETLKRSMDGRQEQMLGMGMVLTLENVDMV